MPQKDASVPALAENLVRDLLVTKDFFSLQIDTFRAKSLFCSGT